LDRMVEIGARPLHRRAGVIEGEVIHVDTFGNLITSFPADIVAAAPGGELTVEVDGGEGRFEPLFGRTFSDVDPGVLIAYIGSGGHRETARRDGSAAQRAGAKRGTIVRVRSGPS